MARLSRTGAAAGLLATVLFGMAACDSGDGDGWSEPDKGQAVILLEAATVGTPAWFGFNGSMDGMTVGSDGHVYGLGAHLVRITKDRKAEDVLDDQVRGGGGLVALPDGSFVVGTGKVVSQVRPDGKTTVLAGSSSGSPRVLGKPVPTSAPAKGFHFGSQQLAPFGTRPDGSVLISDSDVVWSLKDGRLKRVYQSTQKSSTGDRLTVFSGSTVDNSGTVYIALGSETHEEQVGDIVTIGTDGKVGKLALPGKAAGVPENVNTLKLLWMTGDGADGVYAHAYGSWGDYILHLRSGSVELVARYAYAGGKKGTERCHLTDPVDAKKLPCPLPYALTYDSGSLVLGGNAEYVLEVATK